jgi:DNA-binding response OmpR family regulator
MELRENVGQDEGSLRFGELLVDLAAHDARRAGRPLQLTPTSYRILVVLLHAAPKLVSCSQLECDIGIQWPADRDTLDAHVDALRAALDAPFAWPMLVTVLNVGYRLADADAR